MKSPVPRYIILDNCQKLIILFLMWITYLCAAHLRISSLKSGSWDFIAHCGQSIFEVASELAIAIFDDSKIIYFLHILAQIPPGFVTW